MKQIREIEPDQKTPIILIAMLTLVVFYQLGPHDFTWWDDQATIHQNPLLNPPTFTSLGHYWTHAAYGIYSPLTYTAWIALAFIARLDTPEPGNIWLNPWIFHCANIAVHIINALLAFALLRRLVKKNWPACCGALLFALHPAQVETVGWISGLKDLLAGGFSIVALWGYVANAEESESSDWIPDGIGTIAFILAMLAKSTAVTVPLIAIGIDALLIRRSFVRAMKSTAIWFALSVPILIVARFSQDVTFIPKAPIWSRPLIMTDSLAFYIYKLLFPFWMMPDYGRRPMIVIAHGWLFWTWIAPVSLAIVLIIFRKRTPWALAAGWIFFASLLPVSGLLTFQYQFVSTVGDHYFYVALLGPATALAFALREVRKRWLYDLTTIALLLLAVRSYTLAPLWHDDFTLLSHNLELNSTSVIALNNLGADYLRRGDSTQAMSYYNRAMDACPDYPNPFETAAKILISKGDIDGAIVVMKKWNDHLKTLPPAQLVNFADDFRALGDVLLSRGRVDEAIEQLELSLKLKPDQPAARKSLELAREKSGTMK